MKCSCFLKIVTQEIEEKNKRSLLKKKMLTVNRAKVGKSELKFAYFFFLSFLGYGAISGKEP